MSFWNNIKNITLKKLIVPDVCICFIFLVPFLGFKATFKLTFFLICSSGWLDARYESSIKHQSRKEFGKSTSILSGNTCNQALRFWNKSQPYWSCLHFLSFTLSFSPWMTHTFSYFSLPYSYILKENLWRESRCFLLSLKASQNHVEERFFPCGKVNIFTVIKCHSLVESCLVECSVREKEVQE